MTFYFLLSLCRRDAEERLIQLGSKKIVQVQTGQVGVTYDNGTLKILHDGTHEINSPTHIVHRFLSTQEKSIRLATLGAAARTKRQHSRKSTGSKNFAALEKKIHEKEMSMSKLDSANDEDLTICETKGT